MNGNPDIFLALSSISSIKTTILSFPEGRGGLGCHWRREVVQGLSCCGAGLGQLRRPQNETMLKSRKVHLLKPLELYRIIVYKHILYMVKCIHLWTYDRCNMYYRYMEFDYVIIFTSFLHTFFVLNVKKRSPSALAWQLSSSKLFFEEGITKTKHPLVRW